MRLLTPLVLIVVIIALLLYYTLQQNQVDHAGLTGNAASHGNGHLAKSAPDEAKSPNVNPKLGKAVLRGRATDPAGKPVVGARVVCERRAVDSGDPFAPAPGGSRWITETDAQGTFEFNTLPVGGFGVLLSTDRLTGAGTATTGEHGAVAETLVTMQPVANFAGKVKLSGGREADNTTIAPVDSGGDRATAFRFFPGRTNTLGDFSFSYLPMAPTTLLVKRAGAAPVLVEGVLPGSKNIVVELPEGETLRGEVREVGTDKLLPQVKVVVREAVLGIEEYTATTNANGEFVLDHLRRATYHIDIAPDRYLQEAATSTVLGGEALPTPVLLRATRTGSLRGRVIDITRQKGSANTTVVALRGDHAFRVKTDSSGYYQFRALPPGEFGVAIDNTGGLAPGNIATATVAAAQQANGPELIAPTLAAIRGRVLDDADHAAQAANVYLSLDGSETPHLATATDADGFFVLDKVDQEASVRVWASRMGRASVAYGPVRVGSAGIVDLNFVLNMTTTAAIRGQVRDASGTAKAGIPVQCLASDTSLKRPYATTTRHDGTFAFEGLRPGNYRIAAGPAIADLSGPTAHRIDLADGEQRSDVTLTIP